MINWLKKEWNSLASKYTEDEQLISNYWEELVTHYTSKNRYYHNLTHIYSMLVQAEDIKTAITDYDAFRFSIWYHDIIYKSTKKNNELKSAEIAQKRLKSFNFVENRIKKVEILIKSTQNHDIVLDENNDNAFLLDLDLSILGNHWDTYETYIKNIRLEYAIFPDFMYKKGRKKVLLHFLERQRIYFTESYYNTFEAQARKNIKREIGLLS